jgi:broad specificity phosphatase PhoE
MGERSGTHDKELESLKPVSGRQKRAFYKRFVADHLHDAAMDLYLVRHGEVVSQWRGRLYGCLDVKLSDNGREEAQRAAQFLKDIPLVAVVSSGLSRTRYGAAWVARGRAFEESHDAELREIDRGDWCGLTFAELDDQMPGAYEAWRNDPWNLHPPEGESMTDVAERVCKVLDALAEQYPGHRPVAVVAHSHVIRAALSRALSKTEVMNLDLPTGSIVSVDWGAGSPAQLNWIHTFASDQPTLADEVKRLLATS